MGVFDTILKIICRIPESMGDVLSYKQGFQPGEGAISVVGSPIEMYVVLTVTDEGSDIAAVYTNHAAAKEHVAKRFETEMKYYKEIGRTDFESVVTPNEGDGESAYIEFDNTDFWSWRIEKVPLRERPCLANL